MDNKASYWFIFYIDQLLLEKDGNNYTIPYQIEPPFILYEGVKVHTIYSRNGIEYKTFSIDRRIEDTDRYEMIPLRTSYDYIGEEFYKLAGKAVEILHWDRNTQYCSVCGEKTIQTTPITKVCKTCNIEIYPSISVAILALVRKKDKVLLVRARNFKGPFHSLVAGFLETGETLEECVAREILEETGLKVKDVTYFGNQAWPYPSGLMVGFIADYESGELVLQDEELVAGDFFMRDNLPELPGKLSLARKMIDWWIEDKV